ncbi:MAG: hypothetical protein JKY56_15880 [Kofleriaceae bacterium]|nr:hypothetical protein [Kofleriaceae bacterium]
MRSLFVCTSFLLSLSFVGACGEDGGGGDTDATPVTDATPADAMPLTASCIEAANHSDLAWLQDNIFTGGCAAFSSCHMSEARQAANLNLESGMTLAAMLNVDSVLFPDWKLVVPGDPTNSYLMVILGAEIGPLKDGVGTMPFNSGTLCKPKLDAVSRWISDLPQP